MGKRKQTAPQKTSEEKRKCLTWNMLENQSGTSKNEAGLTLIDDNDPRLIQELEDAERIRKKERHVVATATKYREPFYANDEILDILNLHLENCLFYVSVVRKPKIKPGEWSCDFGEFQINFLPELNIIPVPNSLPEVGECWLYVGIQSEKSLLYYEVPDDVELTQQKSKKKKLQEKKKIVFWNVDISLPIQCMEALKCSVFQVVIESYDFKTLTVDLKIIASEAAISNLSFVSEGVRPRKQNQAVTTLVKHFYKIQSQSYEELKYNKKHDIDKLYKEIKQRHLEENRVILPDIQHPSFKPQLRLYQQQAITWMVQKEKQAELDAESANSEALHMLYTEITTRDNKKLYYNKHGGMLILKKPHPLPVPPAGILGDEMGLGKTVEVLGCMLHNPRTDVPKPEKLPVIVDDVEVGKKEKKKEKKSNKKKRKETVKIPEQFEEEPDSNTGSTIIYSVGTDCEDDQQADDRLLAYDTQDQDTGRKEVTVTYDPVPSTSKADQTDISNTCSDETESDTTCVTVSSALSGDDRKAVQNENDKLTSVADSSEEAGKISPENVRVELENSLVAEINMVENRITFKQSEDDKDALECQNQELDQEIKPYAAVQEMKTPEKPATDKSHNKAVCISGIDSINDRQVKSEGISEREISDEMDSFDEIKGSEEKSNSRLDEKDFGRNSVMKRKRSQTDFNLTADQKPKKNIFTEMPAGQRECFECICGATEAAATSKDAKKHPVQCVKCSLWQHAECVNYDLKDVYRGLFKCPHCHVSSPPVVSGATLIISPASIAHQWVEEVLKHVVQESLNVFMYTGVNKQGFIQPQTLAQQDIVITTYETLRKEIDYVDLPHNNSSTGRRLRHPKRFMAIPSPITAVEWWRICLDEAQMVECTTTKTAEMALKLSAVNRWCVTGTPIQKGVEDLYGLLLFLGIDPFWVQQWWNKLVYEPFCYGIRKPMHDLLTSVLWRTMKKDVLDQVNIPKQTGHIHWLTFSPVEDHFYRRQYKECSKLAMEVLQPAVERLSKFTDRSTRLSSLDRYTINQLLYPLLRLRQACCHPQAVRGEFLPIHKSTMTMEQLLESLTKKAKLEAEESHRALVAAINGQAALDIINQQFADAVENYREVLRSVEEHKDQLHTDSLQQLHAMFNLREILSTKPRGVSPTLRDDLLSSQITELKDKYMAKAIAYVTGTREALIPVQLDVKSLQGQFAERSEWWVEVIEWAIERDQQEILIEKVRDDMLDNRNPELNSVARSIRSVAGLEYIVDTRLSSIKTAYEKVLETMKGLEGHPSQELINKTVECCLRPVGQILKTCPFCKSEDLFEVYEARLFSFVEKTVVYSEGPGTSSQVNTKRQGTWADSEVEKALKSILGFAKNFKADEELIEFGTTHIKLFDALKKEYKKMRTHWAGIKEHVSSFDELDMATTRLRLRLSDEPKPDTPQPNILERSDLSQHKLKLASDKIVAEGELRKKLGQLLYLKNLEKSQLEGPGGDNPEPCPICQQELGKEWSVMQCGHCFCIDCIRIVVDRYSFGGRHRTVKCAVCRQTSLHGEISYVTTTQGKSVDDDPSLRVKGSHSTKVEAVVRCLLKIKRDDPTAKALVFSTWVDVLSVIASAMSENGIEHRALYTPGKFQAHLSSFKQDKEVMALLLPVHSGANGLNLIEATYVLLVEPVLNPAQELQAIGRVHRIGQTRPTQVHRFLIKHTIEQKMQTLLESLDVKAATKNAEENALTIGDLVSLFTQQIETQDDDPGDISGPPLQAVTNEDIERESDDQDEVQVEDIVANVGTSNNGSQETDSFGHQGTSNGQQVNVNAEGNNVISESSDNRSPRSSQQTEKAGDLEVEHVSYNQLNFGGQSYTDNNNSDDKSARVGDGGANDEEDKEKNECESVLNQSRETVTKLDNNHGCLILPGKSCFGNRREKTQPNTESEDVIAVDEFDAKAKDICI